MKKQKKERGITLITLIITLIVLMITISVTIAMLTGDKGIIKRSRDARTQEEINEEYRIVKTASLSAQKVDNMGKVTKDNLKYYLDEVIDDKYEMEESGTQITVKFKESEREYIVQDDGKVIGENIDKSESNTFTSIELSPNVIPGLGIGKSLEIRAITNATGEVTWETSNDNVISIQVNSEDDKKATITGILDGACTISAKVTQKDGTIKKAFCNVKVKENENIEVTNLELDKNSITIDLSSEEKTAQINANVYPEGANNKLTWTSSNPKVAIIDASGKVTAVSNGEAIITIKTENGKEATCKIAVETSPLVVRVQPGEINIDLNDNSQEQLTAIIGPETANVNTEITWTSSDESIAKVDENGHVVGIKNGEATISATAGNGVLGTCKVIVHTSPSNIIISESDVKIDDINITSKEIFVTIEPPTADINRDITWTSSDTNVATISGSDTDNATGTIQVKTNGTTTITAKTQNGKTATCNLVVDVLKVSGTNASYSLPRGSWSSYCDRYEDVKTGETCKDVTNWACVALCPGCAWILQWCTSQECTPIYENQCVSWDDSWNDGTRTISFKLNSNIPTSKLKLVWNGGSSVRVGTLKLSSNTYKFTLYNSSSSSAKGTVTLKYINESSEVDLYTWTIK